MRCSGEFGWRIYNVIVALVLLKSVSYVWTKEAIMAFSLRCRWELGDVVMTLLLRKACIGRLGIRNVVSSVSIHWVKQWLVANPATSQCLGQWRDFTERLWGYWFVISFEFFSWNIGLEMSISSETASALMFCHGEKLERNVVVCEQMASLQLLWQLVPGHLHAITWSCKMIFIMKCVIVHILSLIYLDFIWYYICCSRVFRYRE